MDRPVVFVCYCQADGDALKQVKTHLAPLVREKLVELWADTEMEVGDTWRQEIDQALGSAAQAVLLISPAFLASEFVATVELPFLLTRHAAGRLTLLPVFLSPSGVEEASFPFTDPSGQNQQRKLSEFQGIASPKKPLAELSWSDRERELVKLARRLRELTGKAPPLQPAITQSAREERHGRYELNIELRRQGSQLELIYRRPAGRPIHQEAARTWHEVEQLLAPIATAIDSFRPEKLEAWLAKAAVDGGAKLASLLFGNAETAGHAWSTVFSHLFEMAPATGPNPLLRPVRLRLLTEEPLLLAMPWRLLAWREHFLVDQGWTIATGPLIDSGRTVETDGRGEIVLMLGRGGDEQLARLKLVASDIWRLPGDSDRLRTVSSAKELRSALQGMRPHWLAFCGETRQQGDHTELVFTEGESLAIGDFAAALGSQRPAALLLCGQGFPAPPRLDGIPFVLSRPLPDAAPVGVFTDFLHRWLQDGDDPVAAVAELCRGKNRQLENATWHVHADYRAWSTRRELHISQNARLLLDRIDQKSRILKEALELARPGPQRVLALVAHAAPTAGLDHHAEQLVHELESTVANQLAIKPVKLELPALLPKTRSDIEHELLQQLGKSGEAPRHIFTRLQPKTRADIRPILFLDCGVHGSTRDDRWKPADFQSWLSFAADFLTAHCPESLRIIFYLAVEVEQARLGAVEPMLKQGAAQVALGTAISAVFLKPLQQVPEDELETHLRQKAQCPIERCAEAARLIFAKTQGEFDATVALVERGQRGWSSLLHELQREANPTTGSSEDYF